MNYENENEGFRARLEELIGEEKPFPWGNRIGLSPGVFNRMWNDGIIPKGEHLVLIAKKTGCSIDWLLTGRGSKGCGGERSELMNDPPLNHNYDLNVKTKDPVVQETPHLEYSEGKELIVDPLKAAFLQDWCSLSDIGKMRVWTMLKEEIARERER